MKFNSTEDNYPYRLPVCAVPVYRLRSDYSRWTVCDRNYTGRSFPIS